MSAAFTTSLFVHFELPFAHHIAKLRFFLTTFFGKAFLTFKLGLLAVLSCMFFHREPARPWRSKNRRCQCVG